MKNSIQLFIRSFIKLTILLISIFTAYLFLYKQDRPVENIIVNGTCQNLETATPVVLLNDQIKVTVIHEDKYEGVVRKTGEQVICLKNLAVFIFGINEHWPKFLKESDPDLLPLTQLQIIENPISELKNKNILISGQCSLGGETITLNQEPSAVLDTERVKGQYFIHAFIFASSERVTCNNKDVAVGSATDFQIESAKLKVLKADELVGKTILLTGICKIEGVEDGKYFNLISAKVKIIEIELLGKKPFLLRAGVESKRSIVSCGGANGKFVIDPYIPLENK